jgi:ribosomal protein S14
MSDKNAKDENKIKPTCKICGTKRAVIKKYRLGICRRCFKDFAGKLGFKKYD